MWNFFFLANKFQLFNLIPDIDSFKGEFVAKGKLCKFRDFVANLKNLIPAKNVSFLNSGS